MLFRVTNLVKNFAVVNSAPNLMIEPQTRTSYVSTYVSSWLSRASIIALLGLTLAACGGGSPSGGGGGAPSSPQKAPKLTTNPSAPMVHEGTDAFPIQVTATKQDAIGNATNGISVSFPPTVTAVGRTECIARLTNLGVPTPDGVRTYSNNSVGSNVTVTYNVQYPGQDAVCGEFTFTATEDGKIGTAKYSGLIFRYLHAAPDVATTILTTDGVTTTSGGDTVYERTDDNFAISVTARRTDDVGDNVSFPVDITANAGAETFACTAVLNTDGSASSNATDAVWIYEQDANALTRTVTYNVTYPGSDITCGDFTFSATEDGKTGKVTYSGLSFTYSHLAPDVAATTLTTVGVTTSGSDTVYERADNNFAILVTAMRADDVGANVSFPIMVNSAGNACTARLDTAERASANTTHAVWIYEQDANALTRTVTYNVTNPASDITCGDFTFTATEDGKTGKVTYSGLTFISVTDDDVDDNDNGLIEIWNAIKLNIIRNNLAGTGLSIAPGQQGNSAGCPSTGCNGYELAANISMGDLGIDSWTPIGASTSPFTGIFNGNANQIIGLNINTDEELSGVGLFGVTSSTAQLTNVHIQGALINVPNSDNVGALVGISNGAPIRSSFAVVDRITARHQVGGLVGNASGSEISVSNVIAKNINGNQAVGGLVGDGSSTNISASYAHVDRIVGVQQAGGLAGSASGATTITASLAATKSINAPNLGGLVFADTTPTVTNSYWDDRVEFRGNTLAPYTIVGSANSTTNLQSPTDFSGIFDSWDDAYCNPNTGEFSTTEADGFMPAWVIDTGSAKDSYPALNCLSDSPQEQTNSTFALVDFDGEAFIVLQIDYTTSSGTIKRKELSRFTLAESANITISITGIPNKNGMINIGPSLGIVLYDSNNNNLNPSGKDTGRELPNNTIEMTLPAGTYYLLINNSADASASTGPYTLRITRSDDN